MLFRSDEIALSPLGKRYSPVELADGCRQIANANMVRAIRKISVAKGYDTADYVLVSFGGAGAQHACTLAEQLGTNRILVHPYSGLLSAYGIGLADVRRFAQRSVLRLLDGTSGTQATDGTKTTESGSLRCVFEELEAEALAAVRAEGIPDDRIAPPIRSLDLRYKGVEATINVPEPSDGDFARAYAERHQQLYGYVHSSRPLEVVAARVEVVGKMADPPDDAVTPVTRRPEPIAHERAYFAGEYLNAPIYHREQLHAGDQISGPAILCEPTSTVVIEAGWEAVIGPRGEIVLSRSTVQHIRPIGPTRPMTADDTAFNRHASRQLCPRRQPCHCRDFLPIGDLSFERQERDARLLALKRDINQSRRIERREQLKRAPSDGLIRINLRDHPPSPLGGVLHERLRPTLPDRDANVGWASSPSYFSQQRALIRFPEHRDARAHMHDDGIFLTSTSPLDLAECRSKIERSNRLLRFEKLHRRRDVFLRARDGLTSKQLRLRPSSDERERVAVLHMLQQCADDRLLSLRQHVIAIGRVLDEEHPMPSRLGRLALLLTSQQLRPITDPQVAIALLLELGESPVG